MNRMVFFFILMLLGACVQAQNIVPYTRISTDDGLGLSSNIVRTVYQDDRGFIWVGTDNGLQRFDGNKFIQPETGPPLSDKLAHAPLAQILGAGKGMMVLASASAFEVGLFDPLNFIYHKIPIQLSRPFTAAPDFYLWKDAQGEIYMDLRRYGLLHYNKTKGCFLDDDIFHLPKGYVPAVAGSYEDAQKGQVWLPCDSGLCIYDRRSGQTWYKDFNPQHLPILENPDLQYLPFKVHIDRQRQIWVHCWWRKQNGGEHVFCFDSTGSREIPDASAGLGDGLRGYAVFNFMFETARSGFWMYGDGALYEKGPQRWKFQYPNLREGRDYIPGNVKMVSQLMEDRDGSLWIATDRGLYFRSAVRARYPVVNFLFDEGKGEFNINDELEMPDHSFFFTSWGAGVLTLDSSLKQGMLPLYRQPPPASWPKLARESIGLPWCLARPGNGQTLWIGCNSGVLLRYHLDTKTTEYVLPAECKLSTIRSIREDKKGQVWLGTQSGRLVRWSDNQFTLVKELGAIIYKIFFDDLGVMWVATQGKGLFEIDPATGTVLKHYTADGTPSGIKADAGLDVEQLNDSTIVFGAGALNFINRRTGLVRQLGYEQGLPSSGVLHLRVDAKGYLWVLTTNGLCRYNPLNNRITTYGPRDGILLATESSSSDYLTSKGELLFAGNNSVLRFPPQMFEGRELPPDVTITDFRLYSGFLSVDSLLHEPEIKLGYDQNAFIIDFAALSYMQRDRLNYYYIMEGLDKEWQVPGKSGSISYSFLPPGHYTFKVYCENTEGKRCAHITTLHIVVTPPFWQTKWFIAVVLLLLAGLAYLLHKMRVRRLLAVEKVRNRVARDLHDDMGSTLSTINILSAMAKTRMTTDLVKTSEYLSKIGDNSQRMMEAMDDIVWSIKPSNDSMQKIVARMRAFASSVLEPQDIELKFIVDAGVNDVKLNMEARRDLFLVFKEAVNNAAKYSKASEVIIRAGVESRQLLFVIEDNGIGFDPQTVDAGNGLGNMQKRVAAMKGRLDISSQKGSGTVVRIELPVSS